MPLSATAKANAKLYLDEIPEDSIVFLEKSAPYAAELFGSVVADLFAKYPSARHLIKVAFMPAHMRHMINCEGSRTMYKALRKVLRRGPYRKQI